MNRRDFLTRSLVLGAAGLTLKVPRLYAATTPAYSGRLLVTLQAEGGWDVTCLCDPKTNQSGEPEITTWSKTKETQQAGGIPYAPFAQNAALFEKYHRDLLVINGVDAQTNSHTTGVLHNWSGRNAEGFPSLTALFAAHKAPEQPLSYLNFGGFGQTGGLIRFSRLDDVNTLQTLLEPERSHVDEKTNQEVYYRRASDMTRIRKYRRQRLARLLEKPDLLKRQQVNLEAYADALESKSALSQFTKYIPAEDQILKDVEVHQRYGSNLPRQIQMTLAAFRSGLASAADLYTGGYDTHNDHDLQHEALFGHLAGMIDLFWTGAEEAGLADRVTLVIGSDFGRTPHYNATAGKDHWPIGSVMVMEKNASWTNRVVGLTDEGHNALKINPTTLQRDDSATLIYPKHVHKALRRHLGLEQTETASRFSFTNTEDFAFFG